MLNEITKQYNIALAMMPYCCEGQQQQPITRFMSNITCGLTA